MQRDRISKYSWSVRGRLPGRQRLAASFEELRRSEPGALAVFDADRGIELDRDGLAREIDGAAARLAAGRDGAHGA